MFTYMCAFLFINSLERPVTRGAGDSQNPPRLRVVPEPVGAYFRLPRRDFTRATELVAENIGLGSGVIISATEIDSSDDLREAAGAADIEVILDPQALELSTPGGWASSGVQGLPWADAEMHSAESFTDRKIRGVSRKIASAAVDADVDSVLAPAHYLETLPSPWLDVDERLAVSVRQALDDAGGRHIALYYPVIVDLRTIGPGPIIMYLSRFLARLSEERIIDGLTLRVGHFGANDSSPNKIRKYLEAARSFHSLKLPIIGEATGNVGLGLLAFGALGAIESGLTLCDTCDLSGYRKDRGDGGGFMPAPRVYLHEIGAFLWRKDAEAFLRNQSMRHWHVCQADCCQGLGGMLDDPRRHFVAQRKEEVGLLANTPRDMRPSVYLNQLAKAVERTGRAAEVEPKLRTHAERLMGWQRAFAGQTVSDRYGEEVTYAKAPTGRRRSGKTRVESPSSEPNVISLHDRKRS